jgi:thiol-disulfide isomerase/thioredoxin
VNERQRWAKENWDRGLAYDAWKLTMTRNLDRVEANEEKVKIDDADRAAIGGLKSRVRVVVLAADWCGDVIANLPVLGRLAEETKTLDVRVFERDAEGSPIDMYLKNGQFKSIPVFAFFDQAWNELGVFTERPDSVTELRARKRAEVYASRPEFGSPDQPADQLPEDVRAALQAELQKMRDDTRDWANAEVVRHIRQIVQKAA